MLDLYHIRQNKGSQHPWKDLTKQSLQQNQFRVQLCGHVESWKFTQNWQDTVRLSTILGISHVNNDHFYSRSCKRMSIVLTGETLVSTLHLQLLKTLRNEFTSEVKHRQSWFLRTDSQVATIQLCIIDQMSRLNHGTLHSFQQYFLGHRPCGCKAQSTRDYE